MSTWSTSIGVVDRRLLPPDRDVLKAIGLSHHMTSALADLVDNSLDAGAGTILIRFVQTEGRLQSLLVCDDGHGMDDTTVDEAMTIGRRRQYANNALGHFGMGLKAASFSQADTLSVLSQTASSSAVGRRLQRGGTSFECDVLNPVQVAAELDRLRTPHLMQPRTVVRWDQVRTFPGSADPHVVADYLQQTVQQIRLHLGLVLHRLLTADSVTIWLDQLDADKNEASAPQLVSAIDPFDYRRSGDPDYPKVFVCRVASHVLAVTAHIWPARNETLGFRLEGSPEKRQGLYFYRNDRLLEGGGWKAVTVQNRQRQLARVAIDISDGPELFTMNMEKSVVHPRPELVKALSGAIAEDGTTFEDYLTAAEQAFKTGNRRNRGRQPVVPPGSGLDPAVKRAIAEELPYKHGHDAIEIRWRQLDEETFFRVDRANNTLWLNTRYRHTLLAGRRGGLNDLPLLKAALYLLVEDVFRGTAYGPRDKDNVQLWQAILTAAVQAER